MEPKDCIIVALDVPTIDQARTLVELLAPHVGCFKVGLELITSVGGPQVVAAVHEMGGKVFYDGKFCDIPNTVGEAAKAAAGLGVSMFNVHASAGTDAMVAAVENKGEAKVLAVTVLTSISDNMSEHIFGDSTADTVIRLARNAVVAGVDGVICSPWELPALMCCADTRELLKVTPGVRPEWAPANDQKRVMTPYEAIMAGASMLVVGRPITKPPAEIGTPVDAAKRIADEIEAAMGEIMDRQLPLDGYSNIHNVVSLSTIPRRWSPVMDQIHDGRR